MKIRHDAKVNISIGKNRKEKSWKNRSVLWSDLLDKFATTHRTAETYLEYVNADKERQAEIKDIGGFVGGHIVGGRRKSGSILNRSLITLDIDFADSNLWDDFTLYYGCAAALYSTHKHSEDNPRYRLIIPLCEAVSPTEYEAIARRIAGNLGIELFDPTTYQPTRLMYWPSTAKDGAFIFKYQDGEILDGAETLKSYVNWQDSSEWPVSVREHENVKSLIGKQSNPLEKRGVIGAFCRTYTIQDAIETFLQNDYEEAGENRYTYKKGSTSAGLVVYDDLYAYSHHGTDPSSATLCNAFDLVRIHKFGLLDERTSETATSKLPSYAAMMDFCGKDPDTVHTMSLERLEGAKTTFFEAAEQETTDITEPEVEEVQNMDWLKKLEANKDGILQTIHNVVTILVNDNRLNQCFAYDSFRGRKVLLRSLPWRSIDKNTNFFRDEDEASLRLYMERYYGITSRAAIRDALDAYIFKKSFHPIKDYLDTLEWDGAERLNRLLPDYLGAEDSPYIAAVMRKTLVAAVARIYQPGIKFDYILTMSGDEGIGKSTLIKKLGGEWFSDTFDTIHGKEAYEQLQGSWLIEMGELKALKKADVQAIKSFVSSTEDTFRPAYGREKLYSKRQCVFFTTTNEIEFLRGVDGNRRFWVVMCDKKRITKDVKNSNNLTGYERDQIWAEALHYYKQGEKLYLDDVLESVARAEQKEHGERDDRFGLIQDYLDTLLPASWESMSRYERQGWLDTDESVREKGINKREFVCVLEIWTEALRLAHRDINTRSTGFLHDLMKTMPGWVRIKNKRFKHYGIQIAYQRIDEDIENTNLWEKKVNWNEN